MGINYRKHCVFFMNNVLQRQNEFIRRSIERYGEDRFDRSRVRYKNNRTLVTLGCKYHGWFEITPQHHLEGFGGCKECMNENRRNVIYTLAILMF